LYKKQALHGLEVRASQETIDKATTHTDLRYYIELCEK